MEVKELEMVGGASLEADSSLLIPSCADFPTLTILGFISWSKGFTSKSHGELKWLKLLINFSLKSNLDYCFLYLLGSHIGFVHCEG